MTVTLGGRGVLDGVDLDVCGGEVVCVRAPSGAGKSTLLRALVRLVAMDAGTLTLDGQDVPDAPAARAAPARRPRGPDAVHARGDGGRQPRATASTELADAAVHDTLDAAGLDASFAGAGRRRAVGRRARAGRGRPRADARAGDPAARRADRRAGRGRRAERIGALVRRARRARPGRLPDDARRGVRRPLRRSRGATCERRRSSAGRSPGAGVARDVAVAGFASSRSAVGRSASAASASSPSPPSAPSCSWPPSAPRSRSCSPSRRSAGRSWRSWSRRRR